MPPSCHQYTIILPYSAGKCLLLLLCIGLPLAIGFEAFISKMWSLWSEELNEDVFVERGFLEYHFKPTKQEEHQCDGRVFKCAPYSHSNISKTIPYSRRCDGMIDCPSGDDEAHCKECKTTFSCPSHDNSSLICLRAEQLCNEFSDCPRGEDEILPECKMNLFDFEGMKRRIEQPNGGCKESEFSCMGFKCIPQKLVCNGEIDCLFGPMPLDEINCTRNDCQGGAKFCASPVKNDIPTINLQENMRPYMKCLPPWMQCDGTIDCVDYSDEHFQHCDKLGECPGACFLNRTDPEKYVPESNQKTISMGISMLDQNDLETVESQKRNQFIGYKLNQPREFHEHNVLCDDGKWMNRWIACSGKFPTCDRHCQKCSLGAFMCKSGNKCLESGLVCDGIKDCKDGSDEFDCQNVTKDCNDPFRRCNGFLDCKDGRDEKNCNNCSAHMIFTWRKAYEHKEVRNPGHFEYYNAFHCKKNSQCVSYLQRCNGVKDCPNGEDEEDCSCYECLMHPQRMYICQQGKRCFLWDEVCDEKTQQTKCPDPTELDKQYCQNLTLSQ